MIKILLADDHQIVREGLRTYIQRTVPHSVIEEACDGDSAFEKVKHHDYALIILDITMPNTDSFSLVSNILALKPASRILIFSMNSGEIYAKKFLATGAMGYLNKEASTDEFSQAIHSVMNNKRFVSSPLAESHAGGSPGERSINPFELLSPREFEITARLMKGETVSEIGRLLNLHTSTIGTFKTRIFEKLQCKNVIELNELARMYNFVQQG